MQKHSFLNLPLYIRELKEKPQKFPPPVGNMLSQCIRPLLMSLREDFGSLYPLI